MLKKVSPLNRQINCLGARRVFTTDLVLNALSYNATF